MQNLSYSLICSLNNPEKGAISFAVFHHVLLEYLQAVSALDNEEEREKLRRDLFEGCVRTFLL